MILPAIHCSFLRLFASFRGHFLESVLAVPKSHEGRSISVHPWFSTSHLRKVYGRLRKAVEGCGRLRKVTPPSFHVHYSMVRDRNLSCWWATELGRLGARWLVRDGNGKVLARLREVESFE